MKAYEELVLHGVEHCPECRCATGNDTEYKDYTCKSVIICAQCGHEWYVDELLPKSRG